MKMVHPAITIGLIEQVQRFRLHGARVLQIGAAEGQMGDPIYSLTRTQPSWTFYRVEPRVDCFLALQDLHEGQSNVKVLQACIIGDEEEEGQVIMYQYANLADLPDWAVLIGSRDRDWLVRQAQEAGIAAEIEEVITWGQPISTVLDELNMAHPDVVITSMNGDDHLVINKLAPTARIVGFMHNAMTRDAYAHVCELLDYNGYQEIGTDAFHTLWAKAKIPADDHRQETCGKTTKGLPCSYHDAYCGLRQGCTFKGSSNDTQ